MDYIIIAIYLAAFVGSLFYLLIEDKTKNQLYIKIRTIEELTKQFITRYSLWCFFIGLPILYFILFNTTLLPQITDKDTIIWLLKKLEIDHLSDKVVRDFIGFIVKVSASGLPLSLTFYYFFFREQRATSESAVNRNKIRLLSLLFFTSFIFSAVFSLHLYCVFDNNLATPQEDNLFYSVKYINRLFCDMVLFIVSLILGIYMVDRLLRNINVAWALEHTIDLTQKSIIKLDLISPRIEYRKLRRKIYKDIILLTESVYQMLLYTVEKNASVVFLQMYNKWDKVLRSLFQIETNSNGKGWAKIGVFERDKACFRALYRTILRSQLLLIVTLYSKHKGQEGYRCLDRFFHLSPAGHFQLQKKNSEEKLAVDYFVVLYDLTLFLLNNKHIGLQTIVKQVRELLADKADVKDIITIYKALIVKAVRENDTKQLTELVYSLFKSIRNIEYISVDMPRHMEVMLRKHVDMINGKRHGLAIYVVLQAILKSIEFGHYSSAGFMIKYLASNQENDQLKKVFRVFMSNNGLTDEAIEKRKLAKIIDASFRLNEDNVKYNLSKMAFLLYAQQKYIKFKGVSVKYSPQQFVNTEGIDFSYIDYLVVKLKSSEKNFGLSFLSDSSTEGKAYLQTVIEDLAPK